MTSEKKQTIFYGTLNNNILETKNLDEDLRTSTGESIKLKTTDYKILAERCLIGDFALTKIQLTDEGDFELLGRSQNLPCRRMIRTKEGEEVVLSYGIEEKKSLRTVKNVTT